MSKGKVKLIQLPAMPPAALGPTGNAALSPGCLAVAARVEGLMPKFDIEVVPPGMSDAMGDTALAHYLASDAPAVIGFSLYMWNTERSLHIAREVLRHSPGTKIVIGGPEVQPDNTFLGRQEGFHIAVTGEGEETFARVLTHLATGESCENIPGTAVRTHGGMGQFLPQNQSSFPIARYPSPYLSRIIPLEANRSVYVETARGCASRCTYCFYSHGDEAIRRLDANTAADLIHRLASAGAREISILDPSFNLRPDFQQLLEAIAAVNRNRGISFFAEIRAEALTETQMELLVKAGFTKLEIGLQSVNVQTLKRTNRGGDPTAVIKAAEKLKSMGIELLVDLLVGLPGDTKLDVIKGAEMLYDRGLGDFVQIMPLSVLPGTTMRDKAGDELLIYEEAPPYRIIQTDTMNECDIAEAILHAEEVLERRLDEYPRPFLVSHKDAVRPVDSLFVDLDFPDATVMNRASVPGARHLALWLDASDIFGKRNLARRVIERRMAVDPYCILDVIIVARAPFPLDLLDMVNGTLCKGPEWYMTRHLALRGENAARRVCVLIPEGIVLPDDYVDSLMHDMPVFQDMSYDETLEYAQLLGEEIPGARIVGDIPEPSDRNLKQLAEHIDVEAVTFASRRHEAWWVGNML